MGRMIDGIEIPEDFEGIDDDIALGLMKDHGLIDDQQEQAEEKHGDGSVASHFILC